jgi:hypothetical protein
MRRLVPIWVILLLALWVGCGEDKGTDNNGETPTPRLVADTGVNEPSLESVDDPVWSSVDSLVISVSQSNTPKISPGQSAAIPKDVTVKAVKKGGKLYLRLKWSDATFDAYPDRFEVTSVDTISEPPRVHFLRKSHVVTEEDQIFVMFDSLPSGGYDVWNWRVLTTGGGGFGKGFTYRNNSLIADENGASSDSVIAAENILQGDVPTYAHKDLSQFNGYVLFIQEAVHYMNDTLGYYIDPVLNDTTPIFFYNTTGWDSGQIVPGWLIDSNFVHSSEQERGSRWDIRAVSEYIDNPGEYHLVLCRKLNTGFNDDLDLSAVDSVKVKIGIFDGQDDFNIGSSNRGFSDEFWLILP